MATMATMATNTTHQPTRRSAASPSAVRRAGEPPRKTVDKAMRVLHAFSGDAPELSVTELADRLGIHKSVVSRLVSALRAWQMLEKDPVTQRIRVGAGAFRVGTLFTHRDRLVQVATLRMSELVKETGHSAHVTVQDGLRVLVVATIESPSALRVIMRVGDHRHLHTTAAGKVFLAFGDASLLAAATAEGLVGRTEHTVTSPGELGRQIARIRREAIAWNRGENSNGAGAAAAPIRDATGRMVAALSTVFPLNVVDEDSRRGIAGATRAAADRIAADLGYTPTTPR